MEKKYFLKAENLKLLVHGHGSGIATDMIMVEGKTVSYVHREEPNSSFDSGWCFMSGHESQEYMDDPDNLAIYDLNTIANYSPDIVPFLEEPYGSAFERNESGNFVSVEN